MRPTLGKEPAAEEANPVGYLSGDTVIGLAAFLYALHDRLSVDPTAAHDYLLNLPGFAFELCPPIPVAIADQEARRALRQQPGSSASSAPISTPSRATIFAPRPTRSSKRCERGDRFAASNRSEQIPLSH